MRILNSAFLLQGKHKAIAERGNAADHSDTRIILQEEVRENTFNAAILPKQLLPKSKSQQKRLFLSASIEGVKIHCTTYFSFCTYFPIR